ncbi:MAG: rane protein of unknown function [Herbinix sp.]|jgi:uncharacterized membrane protein YgaE (UPF0421/DUF939 family)|nr:rane protein of unknown function [Herbinix sp.]
MNQLLNYILLKREAHLFDAKLYIIKSLAAVFTAYAIVPYLPLVHKDLISVLFGLMMTLEPVTVTGIRSGINQIISTLLGAVVTAIIISVFGINIWTVAISISATLFLCLKINWREVSPVAIFTSIYMTQYVQYTASGEQSIVLTFLIRILSLGIGVLTAIIFNFLFSMFFYKKMERKRIAHSLLTIADHMKQVKIGIEGCSLEPIYQVKESLPGTFHSIDWLSSLIKDKEKEAKMIKKISFHNNDMKINSYHNVLGGLRNITHLIYDTIYILTSPINDLNEYNRKAIASRLDEIINECDNMAANYEKGLIKYTNQVQQEQLSTACDNRIDNNLAGIQELLNLIKGTHSIK